MTLFADGPADLAAEDAEQLRAAGVTVDERPIAGLRGPGDTLAAVAFADGAERPCEGLLVPITMHQRSTLAEQLGAVAAGPGPVSADAIDVDAQLRTSAGGVFAAGDVSVQMPSVANAIAAGSIAAAMIVHDVAFGG